jgi:transcriptional regulator with XRE-family HTH domain
MPTVVERVPKLTRLRAVRRSKFLSPRELADQAGVSVQAIYKLERGEASARYETTRKLAAALEVHPSEIVDPDELSAD